MQYFQLKILSSSIMGLQIMLMILMVLIVVLITSFRKQWRKKNLQCSRTIKSTGEEQESQLKTDLPQQNVQALDAEETSEGTCDPAETPSWNLARATEFHGEAQQQLNVASELSKVKIFHRQCKYLVKHLGKAIESNRKSLHRSLSPEHERECLGALKLVHQVAKEVGSFVRECCNEKTWMQIALTSPIVPERVYSWRWHLKICKIFLCNSNKLGAAWRTIDQHGGLRKVKQLKIKKMASEDECDLMTLLKSMLDPSKKSESNVLIQGVELVSILLERLKAHHAMSNVGSLQSSSQEDTDRMRPWKVDLQPLRRERKGANNNAIVFEGEWFGGIKVAIKDMSSDEFPKAIRSMVAQPSHPNIVSFLGYSGRALILELMDGDLRTLMDRRMQEDVNRGGPFSIWEACDIMLQVAQGVRYMHRHNVIHRYLKSSKILVRSLKDDKFESIYAKVSASSFPKRIEKSIAEMKGRTRWMAPEVLEDEEVDYWSTSVNWFKIDVYSFGITCSEILTGELPFSSIKLGSAVRMMVLNGVRPTLPEKTPQNLRNLIKLCWDPEPFKRPSFSEICEELRYIRCSLLLEPQDPTPQQPPPAIVPLSLPPQVSKFQGEYSSLKVVRKLGSGGSEMVTVYLSTWLQPKQEVADKVAQKRFMGSHNECFINEVTIMVELDHSNVVRLLHYTSDRRSCSIVMELMDEDLHDLMHQRRLGGKVTPTGPFSMADAVHVILQIAGGMQYVHEKYVVHRDLKSCNILIKKASDGGKLEVKVADFGLSMKLRSRDTLLSKEKSGVGTIRWMAPEVTSVPASDSSLMYDPFKSDVFSFGMLCYEILVGRVPFYAVEDLDTVRKNVLNGRRPTLPEWTPPYLKDLIKKCWVKEPSKRPAFTDIVGGLTKWESSLAEGFQKDAGAIATDVNGDSMVDD